MRIRASRPPGRDPRLTHLCPSGTTCYQGKCRALAGEGGECMNFEDCESGRCRIEGGIFGKCEPRGPEKCVAR